MSHFCLILSICISFSVHCRAGQLPKFFSRAERFGHNLVSAWPAEACGSMTLLAEFIFPLTLTVNSKPKIDLFPLWLYSEVCLSD